MVLAGALFGIMGVFTKVLAKDLDHALVVFFRAFVNLLFVLAFLLPAGLSVFRSSPWERRILITRGTMGFISLYCYFFAIEYIPFSLAVVLGASAPFFVRVLDAVWNRLRGRTPKKNSWSYVFLGFIGLAMVVKLDPRAFDTHWTGRYSWGVVMGTLAGFFAACSYLSIERVASRVPNDLIVFYFALIATVGSAPLALPQLNWQAPQFGLSALTMLRLLAMGLAGALGQKSMTSAYRFAPASFVSFMALMTPVFGVAGGVVFLDERFDALQCWGAAVVAVALAGTLGVLRKFSLPRRTSS